MRVAPSCSPGRAHSVAEPEPHAMPTNADHVAVAALKLADELNTFIDDRVADEAIVMTALCELLGRRVAGQAADHEGAKSGAMLVARLIATRAYLAMVIKTGALAHGC